MTNRLPLALLAGLLIGELFFSAEEQTLWAKPSSSKFQPTGPTKDQPKEALPRIVFLNHSAVLIASKRNLEKYRAHQARLIDMMNQGVVILVCPECMKQYNVDPADLIDGVQIGKPGLTQES